MSYKPYNTNRAIIVLIVAIVFYLVYLLFMYLVIERFRSSFPALKPFSISFLNIFYPMLLLSEIFIYRWLRNKYIIRKYANLHIWCVLFKIVFVPPLAMLAVFLGSYYFKNEDLASVVMPFKQTLFWGGTGFFIIGHIFLIMVILKRNKWPSQLTASANDQLQEFDKDAY
jgi:hypothetical protein